MATRVKIKSNATRVTAPSSDDCYLDFPVFKMRSGSGALVAKLTVVSGTFKFSTIDLASESQKTYSNGTSVYLTLALRKDKEILYFQAANADETFDIEI